MRYLNEGVRVHAAELTDIDEGAFGKVTNLDIVANRETVDLPADFFKARALYKVTNQENILLTYRNNLTDSYFTTGGTNSNVYFPYYYFRGNQIVLRDPPVFDEANGLLLEYIAFPETLFNGSDPLTAQIAPIFRQVIEMYVVYKAKLKESLNTGVQTHAVAAENLRDLLKQFRDISAKRSRNPVYAQAWNPESC